MTNSTMLATRQLTLRWMVQRDLPHVLQIERQVSALHWKQKDFLSVFQSGDTAGWVAELHDHVAGFLIYKAITHPEIVDPDLSSPLPFLLERPLHPVLKPLQISMLNVAVAPAWQRRGVGRRLWRNWLRSSASQEIPFKSRCRNPICRCSCSCAVLDSRPSKSCAAPLTMKTAI